MSGRLFTPGSKGGVGADSLRYVQNIRDAHVEIAGPSKQEKIRRKRAAIVAAVKQRQSTA